MKFLKTAYSFLKKIFVFLFSVIEKNRWLILFYTLVQAIPVLFLTSFSSWYIRFFALCFVFAYIMCFIGEVIAVPSKYIGAKVLKYIKKTWQILCHIFVYTIAFLALYLMKAFGLGLNNRAIQLLLQTNKKEASEFFSTYILSFDTFLILSLFIIIAFAEFLVLRKCKKFNPLKIKPIKYAVILFFLIGLQTFSYAIPVFTAPSAGTALKTNCNINTGANIHTYIALYIGLRTTLENRNVAEKLRPHISDTRIKSKNDYPGSIILIIGESHIKRHSSLYGYNKETNPKLESIRDSLFIFNDVISMDNITSGVFRNFLSVSSLDDGKEWYMSPLYPAVFKAAGWNVELSSNQFTDTPSPDPWNAAIDGFLNDPQISKACFNKRNSQIFDYDSEMIDSIISSNTNFALPNLLIINLIGQHVAYCQRFPEQNKVFSIDDYNDRTSLSDDEKQLVADYDNACRFNDEQIFKIIEAFKDEDAIVIYLSDHGEEVYDYKKHAGRDHNLKANAPLSYHYQIDIPFIVWVSAKYKAAHPEMTKLISQAVDRPFMTDDLCHLLFYLANIDTEWFDPTRCLIHPRFNASRKRILKNGDNYDELSKAR